MTSLREVALLRLVAQRIAGPPEATPADVVRRLTAMQAQDHSGVVTSVALRTAGHSRADVEAAFDAGQVVKSWPMRGTLHLVAAEDLPWLLPLTASRVVAGSGRRRAELGIDAAVLERARQLTVDSLGGGRQLRREELFAAWEQGGLDPSRQRGYHLLAYLAQTGLVCFGPARGGEMLIVLVAEWIPRPRHLEREQALAELAERYFRSHGPATAKDLGRWAHLVAADVRAGLALARPRLAAVDVDGVEHLMDPQTSDLLAEHRAAAEGVFLLPGFDEYVLGYQDRSAAVPAEHAERIVPGGNGVFRPTVVSAGQVVGTWQHTGRGAKRTVAATPFTAFPADVTAALPQVYAALP